MVEKQLELVERAREPRIGPKGETFERAKDGPRLDRQYDRVLAYMENGKWRTLHAIAVAANGSEAGVSARLRQIRANGHEVNRERRAGGMHVYQVIRQ